MTKVLAYIYNNSCRESIAKDAPPSSSGGNNGGGAGYVVINSSVGLRSTNFSADVKKIQNALNRLHEGYGGTMAKPLVEDGVCGPKTVKAIQDFQLRHFGWNGADGKINPHGETLAKINEKLNYPPYPKINVYNATDPVVDEYFKKTVEVYLREARLWIQETRAELRSLEPFIDTADIENSSLDQQIKIKYKRFNNIFAIEQSQNKRQTLRKILQVYDDMERVFQRSSENYFEVYKGEATGATNTGYTIAFTTAGGFYHSGNYKGEFGTSRRDRIYLMPSGMVGWINHNSEVYTSVLIHELSHFVGWWHSVGTIKDWDRDGTLLERLRSANTYQRYARAVHFRRMD